MDGCRTAGSSAIGLLLIAMTACNTADDGDQSESGAAGSTDPPTGEPVDTSSQIPCENSIGDDAPGPDDEIVAAVVALPSLNHPALRTVQLDDASEAIEDDVVETGWAWAKRGIVVHGSARVEVSVPEDLKNDMRIGWGAMPSEPLTSVFVECAPADRWFAFAGGYWVREPGCYTVNVSIDNAPIRPVDVGIGEPCPGQDPPTS